MRRPPREVVLLLAAWCFVAALALALATLSGCAADVSDGPDAASCVGYDAGAPPDAGAEFVDELCACIAAGGCGAVIERELGCGACVELVRCGPGTVLLEACAPACDVADGGAP